MERVWVCGWCKTVGTIDLWLEGRWRGWGCVWGGCSLFWRGGVRYKKNRCITAAEIAVNLAVKFEKKKYINRKEIM